jgi:DNA-binding FadR family transcriptional regulator
VDETDDLMRLRRLIEASAARGETQLPPEPRLSEVLGVSRGRLRTLLKRVEEDGLIWRHVGKGTFIGQRELSAASPGWAADISLGDVMDARQVLEPQLAAQAAIAARPADLAAMARCMADMEATQSYAQWKLLDERLHRLIATATRNSLLLMLYDTLRVQGRAGLDARLADVYGQDSAPHATTDQHRRIVEAITTGDPARAEQAMRDHLVSVRAHLFGLH